MFEKRSDYSNSRPNIAAAVSEVVVIDEQNVVRPITEEEEGKEITPVERLN